jgi:ParB-like chromosome segregation protein Spo0J
MFKNKEHTVLYTTDVEMFRPTTTNRNLDMSRVKEIAKSMSEEGLLLVPITVNKKKQVIDGEHRLEAAKYLLPYGKQLR